MNFGNTVAEIQQKYEREREKAGERECMNFSNVITEIPTARSACPSVWAVCLKWDVLKKKKSNSGNTNAKMGEKKFLWQCHCRNRGRKKIVVAEIWGGIKKISATSTIFLQHFHNKSHVISYY